MSLLIFTLDFHQLVRGSLQPNKDCHISYDPQRLAAAIPGFVHGSPDFRFTAHIQAGTGSRLELPLYSPTGIVPHPDISIEGNGSMLAGRFDVPDAAEFEIWISMVEKDGTIRYDSNLGSNYHFRTNTTGRPLQESGTAQNPFKDSDTDEAIPTPDVQVTKAMVTDLKAAGVGKLSLAAITIPAVDQLIIRYRVLNQGDGFTEYPVALSATGTTDGKKNWTAGEISIPYGATVVYDIKYVLNGYWYTMENNGYYYHADTAPVLS